MLPYILEDVSKYVDISPYYFSKLFKEETGNNFIEYLTKLRMEEGGPEHEVPHFYADYNLVLDLSYSKYLAAQNSKRLFYLKFTLILA